MDEEKMIRRIESFREKKALVVGDVMLDEYIWGKVNRISPEAPVPVVRVGEESRTVGGAGNVALNLSLLGMEVHLAGVIGNDYHGRNLLRIMKKKGINCDGICEWSGLKTIVKTRIVAHGQHMVRIDRENSSVIPTDALREMRDKILHLVNKVDFIIVSDYNKGTIAEETYRPLVDTARKQGKMVLVDPKKRDVGFYKGCHAIKPNRKEVGEFSGVEVLSEGDLFDAGRRVLNKTKADAVLITRGEEGMSLLRRRKKIIFNVPAFAKEVYDVTGAGDTVISTFSASLATGGNYEESAILSNIAAAVVVEEVGTSPITKEKLIVAVNRYAAT